MDDLYPSTHVLPPLGTTGSEDGPLVVTLPHSIEKKGGGGVAGLEGELQRLYFNQKFLHIPSQSSQSSGHLFLTSNILIPFEAVCTVAMEMTETTGVQRSETGHRAAP